MLLMRVARMQWKFVWRKPPGQGFGTYAPPSVNTWETVERGYAGVLRFSRRSRGLRIKALRPTRTAMSP